MLAPSVARGIGEDRANERLLGVMRDEDRELLALWAQGQASVRSLARVLGCHSGTISRRLRQLQKRLRDPIARTLVMCEGELPARHREVGVRVLCQGEKVGQVSRCLGMSCGDVHRVLDEVRGWAKLRSFYTNVNGRKE